MGGGERRGGGREPSLAVRLVAVGLTLCATLLAWVPVRAERTPPAPRQGGADRSSPGQAPWTALIAQAEGLGLPTGFLRLIPPGFVTFEFGDLRAFAAEYHPEEHRMVLNRSLSFNRAGSVLRPLAKLPHHDLKTLYHELFHAYMDFVQSRRDAAGANPGAARLAAFAKRVQPCRYQYVEITPVQQRKTVTEGRLLTEREGWEALNETWAVFVGWVTWTKLELASGTGKRATADQWLARLKKADQDAEILGYYEPEDPEERAVTRKRYLAPIHRITPAEVAMLLEVVFEDSPEGARRAASVMEQDRPLPKDAMPCQPEEPSRG